MKHILSILAIIVLSFSCQEKEEVGISEEADAFLKEVLQVVENDFFEGFSLTYILNKPTMDRDMFLMMQGAKTTEDTYPVIDELFRRIGDHGNYLLNSKGEIVAGDRNAFDCISHPPHLPQLPQHIAYISLQSTDLAPQELAVNIQNQIKSNLIEEKDYWIVDLRNLDSGSLEGMLAGLGPLLGDGVLGSFFFSDQKIELWEYKNGTSYINNIPKVTVPEALEPIFPLPKVAVLIDQSTCRIGEQLALSLYKRPNTSFFGNATRGRAFLESQANLSNGHVLHFVYAALRDRENVLIGFMLHPNGYSKSTVDFEEVFDWLENGD